jgi:ABC-type multidrug transport system ATPase subunit
MDPIVAKDITRYYSTGRGVDNVSLSVKASQCFGVLGANGSGKTTLTRLVAGLDRVESGEISVLGKPAYPRPSGLRKLCGVSLDAPAHWEDLSGRQNLWFFARQYGINETGLRRRVNELLDEADLATQADEAVAGYSFGMRRKLTIIEALVHEPDLLILDEPSAGVDVAFQDRLVELIHQRCECGKTTWIADNNADWLARAATDVILLSEGRIKAQGSVQDLIASVSARNRIEIVLEQPDFSATPNINGVMRFSCKENRLSAEVDGNPELPIELLKWIIASGGRVRSMEVRSVTLNEALVQRTAQGRSES